MILIKDLNEKFEIVSNDIKVIQFTDSNNEIEGNDSANFHSNFESVILSINSRHLQDLASIRSLKEKVWLILILILIIFFNILCKKNK